MNKSYPGSLHGTAADRKVAPIVTGALWYFPDALAAVSYVSLIGNKQHNPDEPPDAPPHDARGKSNDDLDCIGRHLAQAGTIDTDGVRHTAKVAWRALRALQKELELAYGLPLPPGARAAPPPLRPIEEGAGEVPMPKDGRAWFRWVPGLQEPAGIVDIMLKNGAIYTSQTAGSVNWNITGRGAVAWYTVIRQ